MHEARCVTDEDRRYPITDGAYGDAAMSGTRPECGEQPGQVVGSPVSDLFALIGIISGIVSAVSKAVDLAGGAATFVFAGMGAIGLAGVAGALIVFAVTGYMLFNRCWPREGGVRCWAGVVNGVTESFDSNWDVVFPSGAMHPRVDVVVKTRFWDLTTQGAGLVLCSPPPPGIGSPMIQTFYKSSAVCGAAAGAMFGAAVGVGGAVAIAVSIGAIGCLTIILCLLALLIAAIVGAVIALIGAAAGGAIGRALGGNDAPTASGGGEIATGDLVTVNGKLLTMEEFDLANVGWWGQSTTIHGSVFSSPPYSDAQAEELVTDACPIRDVPRGDSKDGPEDEPSTGDSEPPK